MKLLHRVALNSFCLTRFGEQVLLGACQRRTNREEIRAAKTRTKHGPGAHGGWQRGVCHPCNLQEVTSGEEQSQNLLCLTRGGGKKKNKQTPICLKTRRAKPARSAGPGGTREGSAQVGVMVAGVVGQNCVRCETLDPSLAISDGEIASIKDNRPGKRRAGSIPARGDVALGEGQEATFCVGSLGYAAFSFIRETPRFFAF